MNNLCNFGFITFLFGLSCQVFSQQDNFRDSTFKKYSITKIQLFECLYDTSSFLSQLKNQLDSRVLNPRIINEYIYDNNFGLVDTKRIFKTKFLDYNVSISQKTKRSNEGKILYQIEQFKHFDRVHKYAYKGELLDCIYTYQNDKLIKSVKYLYFSSTDQNAKTFEFVINPGRIVLRNWRKTYIQIKVSDSTNTLSYTDAHGLYSFDLHVQIDTLRNDSILFNYDYTFFTGRFNSGNSKMINPQELIAIGVIEDHIIKLQLTDVLKNKFPKIGFDGVLTFYQSPSN